MIVVDRMALGVLTQPGRGMAGADDALNAAFEARLGRATRQEMALRLLDSVPRRLPSGVGPGSGRDRLTAAGRIAAAELERGATAPDVEIADTMRRLRCSDSGPETAV